MIDGPYDGLHAPLHRVGYLMLGWGSVGCAYLLGADTTGVPYRLPGSDFDAMIGYHPAAIWPYLSFFLLIPLAFAKAPLPVTRWLCKSLIACALLAGIVFQAFPTSLSIFVPPPRGNGLGDTLLIWIRGFDTARNCLPSLHVALSLLSVAALTKTGRTLRNFLLITWAIAIAWFVIALRRHGAADIAAAVGLALMAGSLAWRQPLWRQVRWRYW